MHKTKLIPSLICLLLACAVIFTGCAAKVHAVDLMQDVKAGQVSGRDPDEAFIRSQMALALELFQACVLESREKNVLISPLSIQLALAMTANGAVGTTRSEMEALLGRGLPLQTLNEYLFSYTQSLPSEDSAKLKLANSIWFRDDAAQLTVEKKFLQTNADYYGAQSYKSPFNDQTRKDINTWVSRQTDGMIDSILDEIEPEHMLYLINALVFDARWETVYEKSDISDGAFTALSGDVREVEMMFSREALYFDDGSATGFRKDYQGGRYSFAAFLPNEDISLSDYIANLSSEDLLRTLQYPKSGTVLAALPKFQCAYDLHMKQVLAQLGMPTALDGTVADFSKMAYSPIGNLHISDVLHKTFISVDELGTKAGAVTKVEISAEGACLADMTVHLDRPFVYMILDNATNLPVFLGVVTDIPS